MARFNKKQRKPGRRVEMANTRPSAGESSPHRLTMREEARNTGGRKAQWSGSQLRHKAVNFVSASSMRLDEPIDPEAAGTSQAPAEPKEEPRPGTLDEADLIQHTDPIDAEILPEESPYTELDPTIQSASRTPEDSSEDEIIFHGRNKNRRATPEFESHAHSKFKTADDDCMAGAAFCTKGPPNPTTPTDALSPPQQSHAGRSTSIDRNDDVVYLETDQPPNTRRRVQKSNQDSHSDAMDDYLANIDQDYLDMLSTFARTDGISTPGVNSLSSPGSTTPTPSDDLDTELENEITRDCDGERGKDGTEPLAAVSAEFDRDAASLSSGDSLRPDGSKSSQTRVSSKRKARMARRPQSHTSNRLSLESTQAFAEAVELDDLYGMDFLDFGKPSRKKKTKKPQMTPDLSDSELELELEKAWRTDREKKKLKKQRREELCSQGLLGHRVTQPDLKTKYSGGMDVDDLGVELRAFFLSPRNSLSLPAMNKQRRKLIHDLAHALSLKSQSRGNGPSRFPVLYKTGRTPKATSKTISQIDKILSRGKFNRRMGKSWERDSTGKPGKARRGRPDTSVSYMDGDVVGASAPEIGSENKGRAMLEKMGWSMGTPLGTTNNKGILLPVAHVVKNSRAGLG